MFALFLLAAAPADDDAALKALLALDVRVATIGDRLARSGLCDGRLSNPGVIVQDIGQYAQELRPAARRALGLRDGPTIAAVLAGSAAEHAGLAAGDEIVAIDGATPPAAEKRRSFGRVGAT